jgi:hypothetical protein
MSVTTQKPGVASAEFRQPIQPTPLGSTAARRELVRRIVSSPTFARSERLVALLTYVCDMVFKGREEEINEQKIGLEIFGRAPGFDSGADGIVRSQASRLRQRLDLYFQQEGANEPVRIVIPRGGYVPVFEAQMTVISTPVVDEPGEANSGIAIPAQIAIGVPKNLLRQGLSWGLNFVLGLTLIAVWVHDRRTLLSAPVAAPLVHLFWSNLFIKDQATMVVAPDSGLVLFHGLSRRDIGLKEYLDAEYRSEPNGLPQVGPEVSRKDWLLDLANRRYTSMVDVEAILNLKDRARTLGSKVSVRYARDLRPNDFKTGTAILLGASQANPWVQLFERNMDFVLKDDYVGTYTIVNRIPQRGEPTQWTTARSDAQRRVFGVVAYMPNLAGNGNALILEGGSMSGTEAALDFVADDGQLLPFLNRIRHSDGTLPHFELLLQTQNMGASAVSSQILAWRTMN